MKTERISNLSLTTITRFTKEQLIARANHMLCVGKAFLAEHPEYDGMAKDVELFGIALSSLTAEPVGFRCRRNDNLGDWSYVYHREPDDFELRHLVIERIYAAPPVPVVPVVPEKVPDSVYQVIYQECGGFVDCDANAQTIWNACRSAMLQGSQPVSNRDELPVIGWLRSDYNSDDKRDPNTPLFMLGRNDPSETWGVKYIPLTGNSPVIPDCWVACSERMPETEGHYLVWIAASKLDGYCDHQAMAAYHGGKWSNEFNWLVTHWMPLPAAPQQEAE